MIALATFAQGIHIAAYCAGSILAPLFACVFKPLFSSRVIHNITAIALAAIVSLFMAGLCDFVSPKSQAYVLLAALVGAWAAIVVGARDRGRPDTNVMVENDSIDHLLTNRTTRA